MNRRIVLIIAILTVCLFSVLAFSTALRRNSEQKSGTNADSMTNHSEMTTPSSVNETAGTDYTVDGHSLAIMNNAFVPTQLTVKVGTTVSWTNHDSVVHAVASTNTNDFDSGAISPNSSYTHTFTKPGTYEYNCDFHSGMRGSITVVD